MRQLAARLTIGVCAFALGVLLAYAYLFGKQPAARVESTLYVRAHFYSLLPTPELVESSPHCLAAIKIISFNPELPIFPITLKHTPKMQLDVPLEYSEMVENQTVALYPQPQDKRELRVDYQFETTMIVRDEGPVTILQDWRHYVSNWQEIKPFAPNKFLVPHILQGDNLPFLEVTKQEIYQAVSGKGKKWRDLAKTCRNAQSYPCAVVLSRIRLRIMAKDAGKWSLLHTINAPMRIGC